MGPKQMCESTACLHKHSVNHVALATISNFQATALHRAIQSQLRAQLKAMDRLHSPLANKAMKTMMICTPPRKQLKSICRIQKKKKKKIFQKKKKKKKKKKK